MTGLLQKWGLSPFIIHLLLLELEAVGKFDQEDVVGMDAE